MKKLSDEELKTIIENYLGDIREMARELLEARASVSGWSIELGALRTSLEQMTAAYAKLETELLELRQELWVTKDAHQKEKLPHGRIRRKLKERLTAAEKVVEHARYYKYCLEPLCEALEAYDKVTNSGR